MCGSDTYLCLYNRGHNRLDVGEGNTSKEIVVFRMVPDVCDVEWLGWQVGINCDTDRSLA